MPHPEESYRPAREALRSQVVERLNAGASHAEVVDELVAAGFDDLDAARYLSEVEALGDREQLSTGELAMGIAGGVVGAVAGGVAWGWLVKSMDGGLGFTLFAIGYLVGWIVSRAAARARGGPLQIVAAVSTIAGVILAQYVLFALYYLEALAALSAPAAEILDGQTISAFSSSFWDLWGFWDVVSAAVGVVIAWAMPKGIGLTRRAPAGPIG